MKRIDPSAVPGKFREHDMIPVFGRYLVVIGGRPCMACAVGIEMVAAGIPLTELVTACAMAVTLRYSSDYCYGLSAGWEDIAGRAAPVDNPYSVFTKGFIAGYEDGKAGREACVAANLITLEGEPCD